jgi:heme exporter protein C
MNKKHWIYRSWWKISGILIFMYVLIGGMTSPLNPGVVNLSPSKAIAGETISLEVNGYNTNFTKAENHAWLKVDSTLLIKAMSNKPLNDNTIISTFRIPDSWDKKKMNGYATYIVYNSHDGVALKPSAVYLDSLIKGDIQEWQKGFDIDLIQPAGIRFPFRSILNETIRNTFFHVALWLSMIVLLLAGLFHAIQYLRNKNLKNDYLSAAFNRVGIFYGILGLLTGSMWARFTWGTWWTTDIKLNMSAIAMLVYLAYLVLRSSTLDLEKRGRLSSVYSIFAFAVLIPLIFVIPRLTSSLHPGNGGNPALGGEDLDNTLRMFFYPSIIALILIGTWIASLLYRSDLIEDKVMSEDNL